MKDIAKRIYDLRKTLKLSQDALGKMLNLSQVSVGKWERGDSEPTGSNIYYLSIALGTTVEYLVTGKNKTNTALDKDLLVSALTDVEQAALMLNHEYSPSEKATFVMMRYELGKEAGFGDIAAIFDNAKSA